MVRISKDPEERKQELIDTAGKLFMTKGYEQTAVSDAAVVIIHSHQQIGPSNEQGGHARLLTCCVWTCSRPTSRHPKMATHVAWLTLV